MRITDSNPLNTTSGSTELSSVKNSQVSGCGTSSTSAASSSSQDQVSLSGPSQLIQSSAADRAAKIASLTASVRSGQYNPSSASISKSLVSETLARSAAS